jgi:hypothetical protein
MFGLPVSRISSHSNSVSALVSTDAISSCFKTDFAQRHHPPPQTPHKTPFLRQYRESNLLYMSDVGAVDRSP